VAAALGGDAAICEAVTSFRGLRARRGGLGGAPLMSSGAVSGRMAIVSASAVIEVAAFLPVKGAKDKGDALALLYSIPRRSLTQVLPPATFDKAEGSRPPDPST
jgi:hypothetical protein